MVSFAGWEMPLQFQGILAEARAVRSGSGLFDVSHMGRIWVWGRQACALLDWVVTADVTAMTCGQGRYVMVCTQEGGILDDGIIYRLGDEEYLLVCNAANREVVWRWLVRWREERFPASELLDRTLEVGMIAFQGPRAPEAMRSLSPGLAEGLRPFYSVVAQVAGISALVSRTGYTGENGFEIMPAAEESPALWHSLLETGAVPCGLGSRDVLRLEAGLLLHGDDMDNDVNPFEAGLDRFVFLDKESVYSKSLAQARRCGIKRKLIGIRMVGRGVPRHSCPILLNGVNVGKVTSGGYSPTLDTYIGLGYVSVELSAAGSRLVVDVRGKLVEAEVVALPFYSRRRR